MPTVLLVRHGQASFGSDDYDVLSPIGARQATLVAERLAAIPGLTGVVTGSMARQRDTATPLADRLRTDAVVDARFDEYDHVALVQRAVDAGTTPPSDDDPRRAFQAVLEAALERWTAGTDDGDGESFAAFRDRVRTGLRDVAAAASGGVAVVTSGGVIAAVCADALGLDRHGWSRLNTVIVNASVTKLVVGRRGTTLVTVNDHAHLEGQPAELLTYR